MADPTQPPDWAIKNQGKLEKAFAKAQELRAQPKKPAQQQGQGSEQVKRSKPQPVLAPKGPIRQAVDSQAHNAAKSKDHQLARARQMAQEIRAQQQAAAQKQKTQGQGR